MKKMTTSELGKRLIKDYEGLKLKAYRCPAGVPTIGYGHTKGVKIGMEIDQMKADEYLLEDIEPIECLLNNIGVNFRQEQFDALVSWIFNLGESNFRHSTMLIRIQTDASDEEITDQMVKWVNSNGKPLSGLKRRRIAEANMWLGYEKYYLDKENNIKKK